MQSKLFQSEDIVPWEDLGNGIRRQVFGYDDRIMMVKVNFQKGAVGELHQHHHTQVTYVADGEFEVTIGDEKRYLLEGDGFYVPPHTIHGCTCIQTGTLVDCFTPHREDFL